MSATNGLAAVPPLAAAKPTEPTLEAIAAKLDEIAAELAELRANAETIASAAGQAAQLIQGKGLLGLLGFGG